MLVDVGGAVAGHFKCNVPLPFRPWTLRTVYLINPQGLIAFGEPGYPKPSALLRGLEGRA